MAALRLRYLWLALSAVFCAAAPAYTQDAAPGKPAGQSKNGAPNKGPTTAATATASNPSPLVVLNGQLSRATASSGEVVRFWITVENRSGRPLEHVALEHLDAPGFTLKQRCGSIPGAITNCCEQKEAPSISSAARAAKPPSDPSEICEVLPPQQTLTVWGDLQFAKPEPRSSDFAILHWTSDGASSRAVVPLGQAETYSKTRSIWETVTGDWQIGITVLLTVFGALYALIGRWIDNRRHRLALVREAEASKRATQAEEQRNTWNTLLLKVHRLAFQHYLPIVSTAQGILLYLQRIARREGDPEENALGAFCYLLRFHWRVRKMKRSGASWYFKKLTAEELVVALYQTHRNHLGLRDLQRQMVLDGFLDWFTEETTIASLLERLKKSSDLEWQFWLDFRRLAERRNHQEATLLSALTTIITFEVNRVYLYWYEERRAIALDEAERAMIRDVAREGETQVPGFILQTEDYLKEASTAVTLMEG